LIQKELLKLHKAEIVSSIRLKSSNRSDISYNSDGSGHISMVWKNIEKNTKIPPNEVLINEVAKTMLR
jgi:hypothetical protein